MEEYDPDEGALLLTFCALSALLLALCVLATFLRPFTVFSNRKG